MVEDVRRGLVRGSVFLVRAVPGDEASGGAGRGTNGGWCGASAGGPSHHCVCGCHVFTWRSRGRVSFQVVPSVRMKLQSAGFAVVQNQTDPHDLTLKVEYREERASQFRIDLYATDITLVASLEHPTEGQLLRLTIRESSGLNEMGNAPYIQVLQRLETNPYFYFLGDIIRGHVVSRLDMTGALIEGLERIEAKDQSILMSPLGDQLPAAESTLPTFESHYTRLAREKT